MVSVMVRVLEDIAKEFDFEQRRRFCSVLDRTIEDLRAEGKELFYRKLYSSAKKRVIGARELNIAKNLICEPYAKP